MLVLLGTDGGGLSRTAGMLHLENADDCEFLCIFTCESSLTRHPSVHERRETVTAM